MRSEELAAIEARANAATPGEWVYNGGEIVRYVPAPTKRQPHRQHQLFVFSAVVHTDPDDEGAELWAGDNDIAFVTASRQDVPALCAEVRRLKQLVEAAYREGWEDGKTFDIFAWDESNAKRLLAGGTE